MSEALPVVLIPGLLCTARLYAEQIPALWSLGAVMVADHTRADTMAGIARGILASAPPRFALVGLSMGGYVSFEILRQAPSRVAKLALLDTSARPDSPEIAAARRTQLAQASAGGLDEIIDALFPRLVHRKRREDAALHALVALMGRETGAEAFARQQSAMLGRPDSRATLGDIRCATLVLVGDGDEATPPDRAAEITRGIAGAHLVTVADCGHLSAIERPLDVTQALVGFLRG